MKTISDFIKEIILSRTELIHIWATELLNLSALAKEIQSEIDKRAGIKTQLNSLIVALNRLKRSWVPETMPQSIKIRNIQIINYVSIYVWRRNKKVVRTVLNIKDTLLENEHLYLSYEMEKDTVILSTESVFLKNYTQELGSLAQYLESNAHKLVVMNFELIETHKASIYSVIKKLTETGVGIFRIKSFGNSYTIFLEEIYQREIYKFLD